MIKLIISCTLLLCACNTNHIRHNDDIVVVFKNAPNHSTTDRGIGHMSVLPRTIFDYVDKDHMLQSYMPSMAGLDTLVIPTHNGYAEVMHRNQAVEDNYYLLMAGDTVMFTYGENLRPRIQSIRSERNTWLYTIPEHNGRSIHQPTGYNLHTICTSHIYSVMWFAINNPRYRNNPSRKEQLERFRTKCPNVDSLRTILQSCETNFAVYIDSLEKNGSLPFIYANFYRKLHTPQNASDILHSDSLLCYPSSHHAVQKLLFEKNADDIINFCQDTTLSKYARLSSIRYLLLLHEEDGNAIKPATLAACNKMYQKLSGKPFGEDKPGNKRLLRAEPNTMLVEDLAGQQMTFADVLKQHIGKVIYIDLWASWCGPCRAGMADSKELRKTFAGKDVVFLYLAVNDSKNAWKRTVEEYEIAANGGINYIVLNSKECSFLKEVDNRAIPQYLLYDKSGNLVNCKAPHPSSPHISKLLNEMISKSK